jgi:hypothetical protein
MNRKITDRARTRSCGIRAAKGFSGSTAIRPDDASDLAIAAATAAPKPVPNCWRKLRREPVCGTTNMSTN